jgi:phenylacetate-coenzyme A ligase PaaK-like adenylate-forming protein
VDFLQRVNDLLSVRGSKVFGADGDDSVCHVQRACLNFELLLQSGGRVPQDELIIRIGRDGRSAKPDQDDKSRQKRLRSIKRVLSRTRRAGEYYACPGSESRRKTSCAGPDV